MNWRFAAQVAEAAARAAGALVREAFRKPRQISYKAGMEPVTETDRASEALIGGIIRAAFPDTSIVGEEGTNVSGDIGDSAPRWYIDPIDGTFFFARGVPQFTISVGCTDAHGTLMAGVVYDPMFEECFVAVRGEGATCNGEPISPSATSQLRESLVSNNSAVVPEWVELLPRCRTVTRTGSAALSLCYVASGRFDAYWQRGLSSWDVAAGVLIATEAGALVTSYDGGLLDVRHPVRLLAANRHLHGELISLLTPLAV